MHTPTPKSLRVVIQQPVLSKYRVPVFRELARRPGIDLLVAYGDEAGIANAPPDGFNAVFVKLHDYHPAGQLIRYHAAQTLFCEREKADVVVLSWSTRYLSLLPGLLRARANKVPTVLWGHGYSKAESGLRLRARTRVGNLADAMLFYNHTTAQQYIDAAAATPEHIFVALNTIDLAPIRAAADAWRADPARLAAFRLEHALDAHPVILFVSRLYPENRTDLLVKAAAPLARTFPGLRVIIIGDGPDAPRLRELASTLGVADTVRFTGSIYGEDRLAPWFLSADVFCYPANIGLSLIHAFGYGVPTVTSDLVEAQNPEIEAFRDGVNGQFYREGDLDSLVETLDRVLADAALRRRLSAGALDTVEHEFSLRTMVDGMEGAIRYAAARRAP